MAAASMPSAPPVTVHAPLPDAMLANRPAHAMPYGVARRAPAMAIAGRSSAEALPTT